jgi:hypothetical protein
MSLRFGMLVTVVACSVSGCFLFHRNEPTPQQQLFEALNRGDGPQATQLWLKMSQDDRMKFNRGEGITPAVPPQAAIKKLSEMDPDDMQGEITIKPPNAGAGLLDLPKLMDHPAARAPAGAAPAPAAPEQQGP